MQRSKKPCIGWYPGMVEQDGEEKEGGTAILQTGKDYTNLVYETYCMTCEERDAKKLEDEEKVPKENV